MEADRTMMRSDRTPAHGRPRIGYVLKMFPRLSETFVLNELLELERQGVDLSVFSLMQPNDGRFHGRLSQLRLTAEYFPNDKPESYWNALLEGSERLPFPSDRWVDAVAFVRRHGLSRDLEMLLRAGLIALRARQQGVTHLHAHFATVAARTAALVGMLAGIPFSFTAHAKDIFRETVDRALFAELVRRAAFCVTVSDFNREFILSQTPGVDAGKVVRLYNGVDLDFFGGPPRSSPPDALHVLSVGRLVPKKGFDHLLRALAICRDEKLPFRATVVGDGESRIELLALRDELGLTSQVELTGGLPQEEVRRLCAEATMMALACVPDRDGNMDALPTVLLEALAFDLPVVSTRLTGIPEIVGSEAGMLVEPGDERQLAGAIRSMWERIRDGRHTPGSARARAERLFDLRSNVSTLRELYARSYDQRAVS